MRTYGQYCPIARGAEIFAERWTPLIIRNLHLGCGTFGEILDGAPGLSRTVLAQRLRQLERLGVVESTPKAGGEKRRSTGNFLRIYRRQPDGSWRMTRDMFNSDRPPPNAAPPAPPAN